MTVPRVLFSVPARSQYFPRLWTESADHAGEETGLAVDFLTGDGPRSAAEWRLAMVGYDAVITSWGMVRLDEDTLPNDRRLRLVAHAAGSVADLVSPELYRRGIRVTSANGIMARSVAEWCLAMTINARMNLIGLAGVGGQKPMNWENRYRTAMVEGATVGIWGYGEIARRYVHYLRPLHPARITVCSHHLTESEAAQDGIILSSLPDVFAADVVVLLAGLSLENSGRVDAALLGKIRPGAALLNPGRARLVDETAWRAALATGKINLYQDVFYTEPPQADDPVLRLPNVLLTPHQGGLSSIPQYVPTMLRFIHDFFSTGTLADEITMSQALRMTSHQVAAG